MLLRREEGQTMAEYGVVLGMVVILTFTAWVLLRDATTALLDKVVTGLH
jgi:Flp pilus assembly pilin Flp